MGEPNSQVPVVRSLFSLFGKFSLGSLIQCCWCEIRSKSVVHVQLSVKCFAVRAGRRALSHCRGSGPSEPPALPQPPQG